MESRKDIYNLWIQYTTKNEETYFRQFIAGFVGIWESQLSLDVNRPPSLHEAKSDSGPHLSRLPDELLPAIGKFLYIAKDTAEKGPLTSKFLSEVELLIKCLTVICRNFDNIPFISSCEYVSQTISIASVVVHKLLEDPIENGESFLQSLALLLEVLYDPYFTWRNFLADNVVDFARLQHQPALLHVEVIPFIYECFQSSLMFSFPHLSTSLLHVLGSVIFGAQKMILNYKPIDNWETDGMARRLSEGHNGQRAICPATVNILMDVIGHRSLDQSVRTTALHCFVAMVQVLHRSTPDQRQIELATILTLFHSTIQKFLSSYAADDVRNDTIAICSVVNSIKLLLTNAQNNVLVAQAVVDTNLLNVLVTLPNTTKDWNIDHQLLATECVSSISRITHICSSARDLIIKNNFYDVFMSSLADLGTPSRSLLNQLLKMICGDNNDNIICNPDILIRLITWIVDMYEDDQTWIAEEICKICTVNLLSKQLATEQQAILAVCEALSYPDKISKSAAIELIKLLENLAIHSISAYELKMLFLLLRPELDLPYYNNLLQSVSVIFRNPKLVCGSYVDMQRETDGLRVPEIRKWAGSSYGFSFHCWVRLDSLPDLDGQNYRRQLFNLITQQGTGMEVFVQRDGTLVVGISIRREFLTAVVNAGAVGTPHGLIDGQWHCLTICLAPPRRPFAHNNISVFIDGSQRLAVTMKFTAFAEPFSYCTIGSVVQRISSNQPLNNATGMPKTDSPDKSLIPNIIEKNFLPSLISQVPSYFTMPLRTKTTLDPQVRSFPSGMQDSVWGIPCCLKGQLGLACLLQEPVTISQAKTLYEAGPSFRMLLANDEMSEGSDLLNRLVFCFSPKACWDSLCIDLAPAHKYNGHVVAKICHTQHIQDVINGVGGVHSLLPFLEFAAHSRTDDKNILHLLSPMPTNSAKQSPDDLVDWEVLPSTAAVERKLDQNPVAMFLGFFRNAISSHPLNQEQLLQNEGVPIIGALLLQCDSCMIDVNVLMAVQLLIETCKDNNHSILLKSFYQTVVFNFKIWSRCPFHIRIGHIQFISTIIKDDRKYFRKKFGIQFFLDTIREFFVSYENLSSDDAKTIRVSLLGIVKFYIAKEVNVKEVAAILNYLFSVREEPLLIEMLEMLLSHLESKTCKDQMYLLMYEPNCADLLYALLQDKTFTVDFKQKLLKFLYVLLRTDRVSSRHKLSLRLQDSKTLGSVSMYPGLVSLIPNEHLVMEISVMLLDQMLLAETESSFAGALSLLYALSLADIDIKLEMARKLLATTFINENTPFLIAKQVGWQDSIMRLLIKRPISTPVAPPNTLLAEVASDLMAFDEANLEMTEIDDLTGPPSLTVQVTEAATALEQEIIDLAGSVSEVVVDNLTSVRGNISSVYSAIKQRTSDLQDTLGRSLTGSIDPHSESGENTEAARFENPSVDTIMWSSQHSCSSSSTEELSSLPVSQHHLDADSMTSGVSNNSTLARERSLRNEALALQQLREEKAVDKEDNLCYLVTNILFTVLWRGVEGSTKDSWKERGQVMACINLLGLNNELYCSHLQLKLHLLEMGVQASLIDLTDSGTNTGISVHQENAAQLMRMVFDLVVLDPNEDDSKKCSVKLLDGVLALLDALLVFQDTPSEDWGEMARLSLGVLVKCASSSSSELVAMATAKLHALLHTRLVTDVKEAAYLLYEMNGTLQQAIEVGNSEQYSFLMPVMKALFDKTRQVLSLSSNVPDLPETSSGPVFFNDFQMYSQSQQWQTFIEKKIRPQYELYRRDTETSLGEPLNTFWAECYEAGKAAAGARARAQQDSRVRFQARLLAPWRTRQAEEAARLATATAHRRSRDLQVEREWRRCRQFLMGERGPWRQSKQEPVLYQLSQHENASRMRLKLEPSLLPVENHAAAASLRDNTGLVPVKAKEFSLPITPAVVRRRGGAEDEEDIPPIEEEELARLTAEAQLAAQQTKDDPTATGNTGNAANRETKIVISQECELITLMSRVKGKLDVTATHLIFHDLSPLRDDRPRQDHRWPMSSLRELHLRKYNLRRSALEIFLLDQTNYFLNFSTKTRNKVFSRILSLQPPNILYGSGRSPAELLRASGLTQRWQRREITNFDYLMHLNTIAGRTYNDLSQYPVFPWVLADYHSEELDLGKPETFRDLSKPIGVVNPKNEAEVRAKYDSFEDPTGTISKFHYGTHYSNSAGVLHYMIRVEPFTSLHIELQSGRFDVADRQFHSIPQTWKLLMDNPNDVKELTPEFYYFPEFLRNVNNLDLGRLQVTKEQVGDVILPPWATTAEDFITLHRRALESEHVSAHLHEWIDLIFGCKQKGTKAAKALNVFYYCSYEGAVDLDAIKNPKEREAVEGMINNFGQTPSQLMRESHPRRMSRDEAAKRLMKGELRRPDMTMFLGHATAYMCGDSATDKDPLIYISAPRSQPRTFLQAGPDCLVSVSKSGVLASHNWQASDRGNQRGFLFEPDPSINLPKARRRLPGPFHPAYTPDSRTFTASLDGRVIYCGGLWDGSVRAYSVARARLLQAAVRHTDVVTCVALDARRGAYLVSGSRDCTCVVWALTTWAGGATNGPLMAPVCVLRGHDSPVTSVALHSELDVAISGSTDGTVNVHTLRTGRYVRTLKPLGCELPSAGFKCLLPQTMWPEQITAVEYVALSAQAHAVFAARDRSGCSLHVYTVNGTWVGSKRVSGRVTGLATAGDNLVCVDDAGDLTMSRLQGLKPVFDIPLHVPIQGVSVAPGNTHVLCPLRDGRLAALGPPVPQMKGISSKSIHHV